ncbi:PPK2 family polyphosphate:nucleotide phosphotransferase [Gelidibacter algens]|uniref:PPK2 family polyphosphate:nucleotide phosphotransferase n=1 Tax=Gelidibacter algens TaxID=49280 RepID=A0A1A7QZ80_9FLAO|nr:PPK2 family polyphosphate kinase [Gelidibacter algens]OBX24573.1 phosphate--nucleotide phosphotransferase [Gelidibacter algens]RAJ19719.1 PPK2 family polyphosphate:nucleotide phosphotransferase [Gelidibacter algens]
MRAINIEDFKITDRIDIKNLETTFDLEASKSEIKDELKDTRKALGKIQDKMYAHGKYAVLVCLQGMDTAGKDSLIREVFKDFNSRGVVVHSFKVPTNLELKHDFLWRHYIALPARGKFGIFNRTHYENVLVTKVHPSYILDENIPGIDTVDDVDAAFWERRYEDINNFEKHIADSGTIVFKFFLNLSKEEQKHRLLRRLDREDKNWKFSPGDLEERKLWNDYMACYEEILNKTSKTHAPWYVIPCDDKKTSRYLVARVLYDTLKTYKDIKEPELDDDIMANLDLYKKQLKNE